MKSKLGAMAKARDGARTAPVAQIASGTQRVLAGLKSVQIGRRRLPCSPRKPRLLAPPPRCPSDNKRRAGAWPCRRRPLDACGGADVATGSLEQDRQQVHRRAMRFRVPSSVWSQGAGIRAAPPSARTESTLARAGQLM